MSMFQHCMLDYLGWRIHLIHLLIDILHVRLLLLRLLIQSWHRVDPMGLGSHLALRDHTLPHNLMIWLTLLVYSLSCQAII